MSRSSDFAAGRARSRGPNGIAVAYSGAVLRCGFEIGPFDLNAQRLASSRKYDHVDGKHEQWPHAEPAPDRGQPNGDEPRRDVQD